MTDPCDLVYLPTNLPNENQLNVYHGPPKPTLFEVFMVNNLVFRWPKPFFFMVLGAHGR